MFLFIEKGSFIYDLTTRSCLQPLKLRVSKDATPLPNVTEVRPLQLRNTPSPMLVTEFGMVIEVRPVQPLKTKFLILDTELGMVIEVRPVQPLKAEL